MENCIFCKIINKKSPADIIYEDDKIIAFHDINPSAPVHILIVPKKHIKSIKEITQEDRDLIGELILTAKEIAQSKQLEYYNLRINVGRQAGQIVDHLHLHLLSNFGFVI